MPVPASSPVPLQPGSTPLQYPEFANVKPPHSSINENVFAVLMDAVRVCSLGQITRALFEVGGKYRRNM